MRGRLAGLALLSVLCPFTLSAEPVRITGRVLDAREPFPGAQVELYPAVPLYEDALRQLDGEPPVPLKSTQTGADGTFELLAPESGAYRVIVQAKDRLAMQHLVVPAVDEVHLPPLVLARFSTITILALGPDGKPLAGLPLRVARFTENVPWMHADWVPAERWGVTGADGKLTLSRWKREPLNVDVTDPRYLGRAASEVYGDSVTIRPKSRPRTVEVLGAQGEPVARALFRWQTWPVGVTGSDGRLSVTLPLEGASALLVEGPGGERAEVAPAAEGMAEILVVRLAPPATVAGRVADALTRKPIAGALVWSGLPPDLPPVRTGTDGSFRLPAPIGRPSWLAAAAPGYQLSERQPARSPAGIALKPAASIRGQVVDTAGAPVAAAVVEIRPGTSRLEVWTRAVWTRSDGSFSFPDLLPGGIYELAAQRSGYGRTEVPARTAPAGQPSPAVRIVLGKGITASGRMVDEAGNPVEGATVEMLGVGSSFKAVSDAAGAFSIHHLAPGEFHVRAQRTGFSVAVRGGVDVPEGDPLLDLGELTLKAGAAIEGQVTDARGRPVEGAEIRVSPEQGPVDPRMMMFREEEPAPDARTGPDGRFLVADLERSRRYGVSVVHLAHLEARVRGIEAPTADPVHIELQPSRSLSGRVVGPEGEPVPDAQMTVVEARSGSSMSNSLDRTGSQGEFRIDGLKPGLLNLKVNARGYRDTWWRGIPIAQDRDPDPVTITLERGPVLEGRVRDKDGNPVRGAKILALPKTPDPDKLFQHGPPGQVSDSEGYFRFDGLAPGEYTVAAFWNRQSEVNVRLGSGTTQVEIVLAGGAHVAGRIVNEAGEPIPSAEIWMDAVTEQGHEGRRSSTQADGSFRFSEIQDGDIQLKGSAHGYGMSEPLALRMAGAPVEGIEIRLSREADGAITGHVLGLPPEALALVQVEVESGIGWSGGDSRVDEQGRYRISGLHSGFWKVKAYQVTGGPSAEGTVQLEPGSEAVLDLQFPEGLTFAGRISMDGRPLREGQIFASSIRPEGSSAQARPDFEGRFSLGPLKPGLYRLHIQTGAGAVFRTLSLQEGQEIALEIETGGLQGRVLLPSGEPVPDAAIQFRTTDPASGFAPPSGPSVRSDAQGAFEMLSIPSGNYTLVIRKPGLPETQMRVEVQPGAATVQDVVLKAVE